MEQLLPWDKVETHYILHMVLVSIKFDSGARYWHLPIKNQVLKFNDCLRQYAQLVFGNGDING